LPQIVVIRPRRPLVEQATEPRDAVVIAVNLTVADQTAVFGDEEEQEPVHQSQQLAVQGLAGDSVRFVGGEKHSKPQVVVGLVSKEAIGELVDGLLDAITQMIAYTATLED